MQDQDLLRTYTDRLSLRHTDELFEARGTYLLYHRFWQLILGLELLPGAWLPDAGRRASGYQQLVVRSQY